MEENKILEEIKQLQKLEFAILKDVAEVCKKHNIQFFLGEGTLLGAIRHKGFIPWDDDVDVIMERSQYERFLEIAPKELGDRYEVQHPATVKNYWSPFMKVRQIKGDIDFRQTHIAHVTQNNGPYIDVFPMEFVPTNKGIKLKKVSLCIKLYRGMLSLKLNLRKPKNFKEKILKFISKFLTLKTIHKRLERNFTYFGKGEKPYMATFSTYHPLKCQICKSESYKEMVWWDFEDTKMPVPNGYDEILTTIYGDYMTPPPQDERVVKHHFNQAEN